MEASLYVQCLAAILVLKMAAIWDLYSQIFQEEREFITS